MSIGPEETSPEVPDSDAIEQRAPALPEETQEWPAAGQLPADVPQADYIEQREAVQPASTGYDGITASDVDADEGDLIEGHLGPAGDAEDDYPDARE